MPQAGPRVCSARARSINAKAFRVDLSRACLASSSLMTSLNLAIRGLHQNQFPSGDLAGGTVHAKSITWSVATPKRPPRDVSLLVNPVFVHGANALPTLYGGEPDAGRTACDDSISRTAARIPGRRACLASPLNPAPCFGPTRFRSAPATRACCGSEAGHRPRRSRCARSQAKCRSSARFPCARAPSHT